MHMFLLSKTKTHLGTDAELCIKDDKKNSYKSEPLGWQMGLPHNYKACLTYLYEKH